MPPPKRLRLLVISNYFPSHGGGIERVADRLTSEFAARDVLIQWFSSDTDAPPVPSPNRTVNSLRTINVIERLTQLPYPIWHLSALSALWRATGESDIVHVHEHLYFGSIAGVLIARMRGRPVLITQHMGALGLPTRLLTRSYGMAARALGSVIFRLATATVFISANVRNFFGQEHCSTSPLIFNGVEVDRFRPASAEHRAKMREEFGIEANRRTVLFVGRFVRKKGLHILACLTEQFPDVLWVFVGSGPEDPRSWERKNVRVLGKVEHDRLPAIYQTADLLVLPSSGEGLPLVVQEALASGVGVLSTEEVRTACPAASDLIRSHITPRIDADVQGWAHCLRSVLADTEYLNARAERAARAGALWSWDQSASEYLRLFEALLQQRRAASRHQEYQ